MSISDDCVASYNRLKHLKLVGKELGVPWQTVYVYLKKAGIEVVGDKARYGSASDRLAVYAESMFKSDVPIAIDNNKLKYQATVDFYIGELSIDVKASMLSMAGVTRSGKSFPARWAYCINKQKDVADYFVFYAFNGCDAGKPIIQHVFLMPKEIITTQSSVSIPLSLNSKWADYEVKTHELLDFFKSVSQEVA